MTDKIETLLAQEVDLSALPYETARYVENLRGMLEQARREKDIVIENRLGLHWSPKSYEERFDDWLDDAVVPVLDPALSRPEGDEGNLIIEGDNVDALRVLARTHKGKVDCVFIDPPYNTENTTFVYNDDYVASEDKYRYSMWLEGLKRRLAHVPDLLSEQGVLLVAINDKNRAYVELLIKENVMPGKFVGCLAWRTRSGKNEGGNANFSQDHEHILIFANEKFFFGGIEKNYAAYIGNDHDERGVYARGDLTVAVPYNDKRAGRAYYPVQDTQTGFWYPANPDRVWGVTSRLRMTPGQKLKSRPMEDLIDDNRIIFPKEPRTKIWHTMEELLADIDVKNVPVNGRGVPLLRRGLPDLEFWVGKTVAWGIPALKRYKADVKSDRKPLSSWTISDKGETDDALEHIISGLSSESDGHLKALLGEKAFNYAKPISLISNLLRQATGPDSLVLDFFGGSGTTAEAVLRLNAEDGGSRRFILVSNTERTADEPDKNLCRDVLRRRVDAVMDGFTKGKNEVPGTGGGYAYLRMERYPEEVICGPHPFEMTIGRAFALAQMSFGLPVEEIGAPEKGYAVRETEETAFVFAPAWESGLAAAVAAEFAARPDKDHVLLSNLDRTPTHHLRAAGCESVKCLDAIVLAGRLCGPALFGGRA